MAKQKKKKHSIEFRDKFQKRFFTKKSVVTLVFGLIVLLLFMAGTVHLRNREKDLDMTISELNTEIKDIEQTNKSLEEEKKDMDSDGFKEKVAREILGMIGKDEYVVKESEKASTKESEGTDGTGSEAQDGKTTKDN